jgi:hypothetical protein
MYLAASQSAGIGPVALAIYVVLAIIGCVVIFLILRNFHRQRDFERSDHVVPEDYD